MRDDVALPAREGLAAPGHGVVDEGPEFGVGEARDEGDALAGAVEEVDQEGVDD